MQTSATGTGHLVRLILRRDRIRLPVWILGITALTGASAQSILALYGTAAERAGYASTVESSGAGKLMNGMPYDVDSAAGITAYEITSTASVLVALMVVFLVVRHTRAEEETGRAELLRSTVTGRHAAAAAAVLVAAVASVAVGLGDALVLAAHGFEVGGSVAHGASLVGVGLVFTGVAVAAAQVTSSARAAIGIACAVLATAFLVRGVGAVGDTVLMRLGPLGWAQEVRPYGEQQPIWLLVLMLAAALNLALAAYLNGRRDAGAGLVQPRPGRPRARRWLGTSGGLVLRLQRGLWLGWLVGMVLTGALFGSLGREVVQMVADNPDIGALLAVAGTDLLSGFFAYSVLLLAVAGSAFAVTSVLRIRSEEDAGRAEMVLATATSRTQWLLAHLAVTLVAVTVNTALVGAAVGATHGLVSGDWSHFWPVLGGALALLPAVLLLTGLAVIVVGWLPRWTVLAWGFFGFALLQAYLGEMLQLPDWLAVLSPFWHLPQVPAEEFELTTALVLVGLAAAAAAAGLLGLRRRDIG